MSEAVATESNWQIYLAAGVAIAALAAFALTALAAFLARGGESPSGPRWGSALGLGIGVMIGLEAVREALTEERPEQILEMFRAWWTAGDSFPLWAGDATRNLPWVVLAATLVGVWDGDFPTPRWARWENRALLIVLLLWLVIVPQWGGSLEPWIAARWMIGLGVGLLAWWTILDARAERLGASMPLVLLLPAAALPAAQLLARSATLAACSGAFAAVMGGVWLATRIAGRTNLARGAVPIYAVTFAGLILHGRFYSEIPNGAALAFALAPLASLVDRFGPIAGRSPWKLATVRLSAVVLVSLFGIGLTWFKMRGQGS